MIATSQDDDEVSLDAGNKPMFAGNASRPPTRKVVLQRLRLPHPLKWILADVIQHHKELSKDFCIVNGPEEDIFLRNVTFKTPFEPSS